MYYAVIAVIIGVLMFAAIPVVTSGFLSFGGVIIALMATLVLYGLLFAPVAWLVYRQSRSVPLLAVLTLLPLAIAFSPLLLASSIENSAAATRAADTAASIPASGIVEVVGEVRDGQRPFEVTLCGTLCQSILSLKGVERLRLTYVGDEKFSRDFVVRDPAYCTQPVPLDPAVTTPARLSERLSIGRCIMLDDVEGTANVVAAIGAAIGADAMRIRQISITSSGGVAAVQTQVDYVVPSLPLHLEEGVCSTPGCVPAPVLATDRRVINPVDPVEVILGMLEGQA